MTATSIRDRGSTTLELVIIAPVILLAVAMLAAATRVILVTTVLNGAARDAARAASLTRSPAAAAGAARSTVSTADDRTGSCQTLHVRVDTGRFHPGGTVRVQLRCRVPLADLALPGTPGVVTVEVASTAPIDRFRGTR